MASESIELFDSILEVIYNRHLKIEFDHVRVLESEVFESMTAPSKDWVRNAFESSTKAAGKHWTLYCQIFCKIYIKEIILLTTASKGFNGVGELKDSPHSL